MTERFTSRQDVKDAVSFMYKRYLIPLTIDETAPRASFPGCWVVSYLLPVFKVRAMCVTSLCGHSPCR